jgi:spermidine synthase
MTRKTSITAVLLFGSGLSALIYQTVWLREFRLIFGASTFATAAVLAIFMAGLGTGSAILGKRADEQSAPLSFYGRLELMISALAALSLPLLALATTLYFALGGSMRMGIGLATIVRLILSILVIGAPTFLMGGTLPAAARAVETDDDRGRGNLAMLYGANTLGAVTGTLLSTFYMLEHFGNRNTLLCGVAVNLVVGGVALHVGGRRVAESPGRQATGRPSDPATQRPLILASSAIVGFCFLLMELVWYRMLGPLLGGTTFTFGLILAVALLGVGLGGLCYGAWNRPSLLALGVTSALEAATLVVPFMLGDRLAGYALALRSLGSFGFQGHVVAWLAVTMIVVFPASLVAGFQFPLLIALLGEGREAVARDVGTAYAWNTAGSILGSLAGGFGLLPLLTAPGAWRLVTVVLAMLGVVVALLSVKRIGIVAATIPVIIGAFAVAGTFTRGPSAMWRHSGIGVGNWQPPQSANDYLALVKRYRRSLVWEADGRESSIAELGADDLSFIVNGKSNGSARADAGTQVMSGMVGVLLHRNPRSAAVIGLGTGSTAGWMATVQTIERVDAFELEPAVLRVARDCSPVNHRALDNPKVHVTVADAREALLASSQSYDIISSEPANPYSAGVASLFTREFYMATRRRLAPGGIMLQWIQAYAVHASTMETIYATLNSVFPHVETFWTQPEDVLVVASVEPITYDADLLRARLQSQFGSAAHAAWRAETPEAFLAHFVANENTTKAIASRTDVLNTDDRTVIEFGFARGLGLPGNVLPQLAAFADSRNESRPLHVRGAVNWREVEMNRASGTATMVPPGADAEYVNRRRFTQLMTESDVSAAGDLWLQHRWRALNSAEVALIAEAVAEKADPITQTFLTALDHMQPIEANVVRARLALRQNRLDDSLAALQRAFTAYRTDPWPQPLIMRHALSVAIELAQREPRFSPQLYDMLKTPIPPHQLDELRRTTRLEIAVKSEQCGPRTLEVLQEFEPDVRWSLPYLTLRVTCYEHAGLRELAARAREDYETFMSSEPSSFEN